ncbi:MAG: prepilin-type N-terminal cleavage/methylation domain-containing protein [Candidatus Pacebacteria bacterium]|nr:prepilin-type N-terminal cleavage/methylation domain-containing protein [Candidatus Paceibacterota bacterium]
MFKLKQKIQNNRGMTYVELIVVLGIFSVMLSIALFNYKKFQGKVDIKNLANDIALKLVESQKSSVSGKWNASASSAWKPSYGVYLNSTTPTKIVYFADLNNSNSCDSANCTAPSYTIGGEVLDIVNITRGNTISSLQVYAPSGSGCTSPVTVTSISVAFKRPSSTPLPITTSPASGCSSVSYYAINIVSNAASQAVTSQVKLYPSGRIQIN